MKKISPARVAAFDVLVRIEKEKAFSSVLLPIFEMGLEPKDRGLCHELTLGVLRRKLSLDWTIEKLTTKSITSFDIEVITALRVGLYQILHLDKIPTYSAINESVNLTHRAKKRSASGLVNAVLRRAAKETDSAIKHNNEIDRISLETSHPRWLVENWINQFGIIEAEKIANSNNEKPRASFRFTSRFYRRAEPDQKNILNIIDQCEVNRSDLIDDSFRTNNFSDELRDLSDSGDIYFQDEGSQFVANVCDLKEHETFIDICAAPGSKTTFASSRLQSDHSQLFVAGDFHSHRMQILVENCKNQGADFVQFVRYDAAKDLPLSDESFDVVLLDAPCSGTGTIRSNPEIRYFLTEKDLIDLPAKQLIFLKNASKLVKRGGRLVYSTCSLEKQENEEVIKKFLTFDRGFENDGSVLRKEFHTENGFHRTFPDRDGVEGFFIAVLRKLGVSDKV